LAELQAELADSDERLERARELGDGVLEAYVVQTRRAVQAELARRNGSQVSIPYLGHNPIQKEISLQTWGDFLNTPVDAQPYTIESLAPDSGLIAFHGRGKDGKTTLLIHACRAIANGDPFLGKATTQKPVVYLNYEMGFDYLQKLLRAGGACPVEAFILNRPEPVLQTTTVEALMQKFSRPGLIVIDSFRGAFRLHGDAENSAGGAGLILRNLQDLAVKHKWLVIVIHHRNRGSREGTDAISGTSDWIAAPDVIWSWSRPDREKAGTLIVEGRMPPVDPLAIRLSPEACMFAGTVKESQEATDRAAIMAILSEEPQKADSIAEAISLPVGTVRPRLEAMFREGLINREGEGKRGSPYFYSVQKILLGTETKPEGSSGKAAGLWEIHP